METKIQSLGKIDNVNLFFDPLRKDDSFMVLLNDNKFKMGFIVGDDPILESDAHIKWEKVVSIIAGFSGIDTFNKIKQTIDEENE